MTVLMGCIENAGQAIIAADPNIDNVTEEKVAFLESFPRLAPAGALVVGAAGLKHYTINHTIGQGKLQGFALKVAHILGLPRPSGQDRTSADIRRQTMEDFYAAAHPANKRNALFMVDRTTKTVSALWVPGTPPTLRLRGAPASTCRLYITIEACKRIAACGMLIAIPKSEVVREVSRKVKEATEATLV